MLFELPIVTKCVLIEYFRHLRQTSHSEVHDGSIFVIHFLYWYRVQV